MAKKKSHYIDRLCTIKVTESGKIKVRIGSRNKRSNSNSEMIQHEKQNRSKNQQ